MEFFNHAMPVFDRHYQQGETLPEFESAIYQAYHMNDDLDSLLRTSVGNELNLASKLPFDGPPPF